MTDTVITDAVIFPQDEGIPGITDGNETWLSAGYLAALGGASHNEDGYVAKGLKFSAHDGTNDEFDLTQGRAFVPVPNVNVQSALGGDTAPSYDTTMFVDVLVMIELPNGEVNLNADTATLNDVWLAYATDGSVAGVSAGDVYLRVGSSETEPPHPNVWLGKVNPDNANQDVEPNDGPNVFKNTDDQVVQYEPGFTSWGDPLTNEPVKRITVPSNYETVHLRSIRFEQKGGGSSSNASMNVYDVGTGSNIASVDLGGSYTPATSDTADEGNDVLIRITNSTGGPIEAEPIFRGWIE